jgi:hypothetical protein
MPTNKGLPAGLVTATAIVPIVMANTSAASTSAQAVPSKQTFTEEKRHGWLVG